LEYQCIRKERKTNQMAKPNLFKRKWSLAQTLSQQSFAFKVD